MKKNVYLGQMLIERGVISEEQLKVALHEQKKTKAFLGSILVTLGFATEGQVLPVVSEKLKIDYIKIKDLELKADILKKVPAKFALHYKLMPVKLEGDILTIALSDPLNIHTLDDVSLLVGLKVKPALASEKDILEATRKYYGVGAETIEGIIDATKRAEERPTEEISTTTEDIEDLSTDASISKFVNQILLEAYKDRATDIHIEPYEDEVMVRYRIDGILYNAKVPATLKRFQSALISRIKIMSSLDITEKRVPQDGRIKVRVGDEDLDLRVSILPTQYGEGVVIRLLRPAKLISLEGLGLVEDDLKLLDTIIRKPHGIIFVTGPTGSGKSTTLYACLSRVNDVDRKIITIEDPIEYKLKGITQIQINPGVGLTFAQGLRSMLRHDPDIMMVGEVRDLETAEISIRIALTGHLVFSTLHTNDAASGITRLVDIGIQPYLVCSSVECFIAQRLVRVICPECKSKIPAPTNILKKLGAKEKDLSGATFFKGKGCESCRFTGYKGRTAIHEFLVIDDDIRDIVLKMLPSEEIKKKAVSNGMRTLQMSGLEKVKKGITTIEEVIRVTQRE